MKGIFYIPRKCYRCFARLLLPPIPASVQGGTAPTISWEMREWRVALYHNSCCLTPITLGLRWAKIDGIGSFSSPERRMTHFSASFTVESKRATANRFRYALLNRHHNMASFSICMKIIQFWMHSYCCFVYLVLSVMQRQYQEIVRSYYITFAHLYPLECTMIALLVLVQHNYPDIQMSFLWM